MVGDRVGVAVGVNEGEDVGVLKVDKSLLATSKSKAGTHVVGVNVGVDEGEFVGDLLGTRVGALVGV